MNEIFSKFMKIAIGGMLIISFAIAFLAEILKGSIAEERAKYIPHLDKKYILDDDTLSIIDYNIWSETFTLSNGVKINSQILIN